jgi:hypothetical protein
MARMTVYPKALQKRLNKEVDISAGRQAAPADQLHQSRRGGEKK